MSVLLKDILDVIPENRSVRLLEVVRESNLLWGRQTRYIGTFNPREALQRMNDATLNMKVYEVDRGDLDGHAAIDIYVNQYKEINESDEVIENE